MEELVAVLEHLVNRGDNPEIVIRQVSERIFLMKSNIYVIRWASERIIGVKIMFSFILGERAG